VTATPPTAALTTRPNPPQDRALGGDLRTRTAHALGLIRKLIDYGKELAGTLQQRPSAETLFDITRCFGTLSIALILARITRGLRIAAALEARLANRHIRPEQSQPTARPRHHSASHAPAAPRPDIRMTPPPFSTTFPQPRKSRPSSAIARSAPSSSTSAAISVS